VARDPSAAAGMAADPARFDAVTILGVDEHIWHHVNPEVRGPKELTGMVDLTRTRTGRHEHACLTLFLAVPEPSTATGCESAAATTSPPVSWIRPIVGGVQHLGDAPYLGR